MAKKTCYYELLGLDRKCEAAEIKTKYRKLALQMHPDKAHANNMTVEEATSRFQQIQEAYSCLSDAQERAWYDAHREQILRGDDEPGEDPFKTKINLYKYFGAGCYDGFGDDSGGFYAVYGDLFQAIDHEEEQWEECDEEHVAMPVFGDSRSEWNDVSAFYRNWLEFCSRKAFGHSDKWNPKDAPNRQVRRAMEQENKKARQAAKKDFNSEVRQIVQLVQKRDPRVLQHRKQQMKEEAEKAQREAASKEQRKAAEAKERKQRQEAARREEEERWAEMQAQKEDRRRRGEVVSEDEASSSDNEQAVGFTCEPCRKFFKSEKAFEQHTKSKKHLQIVAKLRKDLERQLAEEAKKAEEEDEDEDEESEDEEPKREVPFLGFFPARAELSELKVSELRKRAAALGADEEELEEADDADDAKEAFIELILSFQTAPSSSSSAKPKQSAKAPPTSQRASKAEQGADDTASSQGDSDSDEDDDFLHRFAAARQQRGQEANAEDFVPPARRDADVAAPMPDSVDDDVKDGREDEEEAAADISTGGSKKAQKREKQKALLLEKQREKEKVQELVAAARKAQRGNGTTEDGAPEEASAAPTPPQPASRKAKGKATSNGDATGPTEARCAVCGEEFPSRTKMFQHVKETGHAAPKFLEVAPEPAKGGKKKKR